MSGFIAENTCRYFLFSESVKKRYCNWSNEGCSSNADCCSQDCVKKNQGTNPRCERSTIHEPCYENYHCDSGLACSSLTYKCCAPYWGSCVKTIDCCDPGHVCREVDDVIYNKCLFPSASFYHRSQTRVLAVLFAMGRLLLWGNAISFNTPVFVDAGNWKIKAQLLNLQASCKNLTNQQT